MEGQIKHKRAQEVQKAGQEKGSFWACRGILSIQSSEQTWRPGEHPSSQHPGGISKEGAPTKGQKPRVTRYDYIERTDAFLHEHGCKRKASMGHSEIH